jgi:Fe-S-cluster containining protein
LAEIEQFEDYEIEGLPRTEANLEWLWEHFECTRCGSCCRIHTKGVRISHSEADALAASEGVEFQEFTRTLAETEGSFLIEQPCRYLDGNSCSIEDIKPFVCREYPLHFRKSRGEEVSWVIITACPGGRKLLGLILSGPQQGLEYRVY